MPQVIRHVALKQSAQESPRFERICILKLDMIGDFITAIPAFTKIRNAWPKSQIVLVCGSWNAGLAQRLGLFDEIVEFDLWDFETREKRPRHDDFKFAFRQLDLGRFDLAIDFRHDKDNRSLLFLLKSRFRAGFIGRQDEGAIDLVLPEIATDLREGKRGRPLHDSSRLRLLADAIITEFCHDSTLPQPAVPITKLGSKSHNGRLSSLGDGYVVIASGAGHSIREWPVERFLEVARRIVERTSLSIVLVGGPNETGQANFLSRHLPTDRCLDLVAKIELDEVVDVIAGAKLFVGNDSGLSHLASNEQVPSVIVFAGVGDKDVWAPIGPSTIVITTDMPCSPCNLRRPAECAFDMRCLTSIGVEHLWQGVAELLAIDSIGSGVEEAANDASVQSLSN